VPALSPRVAEGVTWFDTPVPEFRLYLLDLTGSSVSLPGRGPRILLCTEGTVALRSEPGDTLELSRGGSCFLSAADGPVDAAGPARIVLATPGPPSGTMQAA
jgi:mannose-6-phosphate isomerase